MLYCHIYLRDEYDSWEIFMKKQWRVQAKRADFKALGEKFGIDQVVARVIRNRDIVTEEDFENYIYGTLDNVNDPYELLDVELAADIVAGSIEAEEKIRIVGDYDVDGVTSTYILYDALRRLGADVSYDIPHRLTDGYGINVRIVEQAYEDGVSTIITCDNGISAVEAVDRARELGMTVVVTDHHEVQELPDADAIIDPHQPGDSYAFADICGAEVAYKFVKVLYETMGQSLARYDYLEFLALATVCDVMPIINENKIYAREGMNRMQETSNIGLRAMIEACGLQGKKFTTYYLNFIIGPAINVAGKLGSAKRAVELFLTEDSSEAARIASELVEQNNHRKELTTQGVNAAIESIADRMEVDEDGDMVPVDKVVMAYISGIPEGVAGVVAGRIKEKYSRPTIIFTDTNTPGLLKGSGRSIEAYNMFEALMKHRDKMVGFGGHPMAAGLSIEEDMFETFRDAVNADCTLEASDLVDKLMIDAPMPMSYATLTLAEQIESIGPFGEGNKSPIFAEKNLEVLGYEIYGAKSNVMKLRVKSQDGRIHAVTFFRPEEFEERINKWFTAEECDKMKRGIATGCKVDIAYEITVNEYNGNRTLQYMLLDYDKS